MKRDQSKGEVRFHDSDGTEYVLRFGTNDYIAVQKEAEALSGREFQRFLFHRALLCGSEAQKDLTLDDAGDIIDDICLSTATELFDQTRFGRNVKQTSEKAEADRKAKADVDMKAA